MPLLCVDVGNARTDLGLLEDGEVVGHWQATTDDRRTGDEWAVVLRGLLGPALDDVTGVAVAATVPSVLAAWRAVLETRLPHLPVVVVGPGTRTGLPVAVEVPRDVGADRVVNAVAALERWGAPVVVVDLGWTATTYDVVDARGRYVGGAIAPGLALSLETLGRRGAQLREVPLERPRSVVGRSTTEALQSGLVHGAAAQVEGMVARIARELDVPLGPAAPASTGPGPLTVVATGSAAPLVLEECPVLTEHDPWLALHGLALVHRRNCR